MGRLLTLDQFLRHLTRAVQTAGSQRELARQLGVSDVYISDVLRGRRQPSRKLLTAMGISRRFVFELPR